MEYRNLNELCEINIGKTPSRNKQEYWGAGYKWLSISDLKDKYLDKSKEEITELAVDKANMKIVPKDTVIMSFKLSIGKIAILKEDMFTNEAIANFPIKDKNIIKPEYLYYALKTLNFNNTDRAVMGATLNKSKLNEIKIPYCNVNNQEKIVEVLDKAQELIDKRREQIEALDELVKSRFVEIFGDPVKNKKDWEVKKLGNISSVGSSKRVFVNELVEKGIPFYRGTEIGELSTGKNINPTLFITEKHYNRLRESTGVPVIGDLLMPSICPDGKIWRVDTKKPFYFKDGRVLWVHLEDININSLYLKHMLCEKFIREYNRIASGTTFSELKIFALKDVDILIPPIELQNEFADFVKQVDKLKFKMENSLKELEDNFNSLMQKAFKGELFK